MADTIYKIQRADEVSLPDNNTIDENENRQDKAGTSYLHKVAGDFQLILIGVQDASIESKFADAILSRAVWSGLSELEVKEVISRAFTQAMAESKSLRWYWSF